MKSNEQSHSSPSIRRSRGSEFRGSGTAATRSRRSAHPSRCHRSSTSSTSITRIGLYPLPLPLTPGSEGAGTVTEVGEGVDFPQARRPGLLHRPDRCLCRGAQHPGGPAHSGAGRHFLGGCRRRDSQRPNRPLPARDDGNAATGRDDRLSRCRRRRWPDRGAMWPNRWGSVVIGTVGSDEKSEIARSPWLRRGHQYPQDAGFCPGRA